MSKVLTLTELKKNMSKRDGDCFPASLSCIVELPYESMPQLKRMYVYKLLQPTSRSRWGVWLRKHGLKFRQVMCTPRNRLYIGVYETRYRRSGRNLLHAVVCYNGEIIHDTSLYPCKLSEKPIMNIIVEEYDH